MIYIESFTNRNQIDYNPFVERGKIIYEKYLREQAKTERTLDKALRSSGYFWKLIENKK